MNRHSTGYLLMRGLVSGLLVALANGVSLPVLHELSSMLLSSYMTGKWHGPIGIAELWGIWFVFGFVFSSLPSLAMGVILSLGMRFALLKQTRVKWLTICTATIIGLSVAAVYVFLLHYFEIILSRRHRMLTATIFVQQILMYGWMAARSATRQRARG